MGSIYSRAQKVIAWFGAGRSGLAIRSVLRVHDLLPQVSNRFPHWFADWIYSEPRKLDPRKVWPAIRDARYWTRAWVIQEFILAPELEIWMGRGRLFVDEVLRCASASEQNEFNRWLCNLNTQRGRKRRLMTFEDVVTALSKSQVKCTDIRDRVYSLLSLVDPIALERYPIAVNYQESPVGLFLQLIERCQDPELRPGFCVALATMLHIQKQPGGVKALEKAFQIFCANFEEPRKEIWRLKLFANRRAERPSLKPLQYGAKTMSQVESSVTRLVARYRWMILLYLEKDKIGALQ